jgi:hypothetical protein
MNSEGQVKLDRLAVLIDAENASAKLIEPLLKEIARYGSAHVKRIYGDWTSQSLSGWKSKLHKYAIQPIQQFRYTTGKNSTDSALIIDAMDLLYTRNFDGFCIVSSDSDFTRLASRIRESGLVVYGFGESKTPEAFVSACDKFTYNEIFEHAESLEHRTEQTHDLKVELPQQLEKATVNLQPTFPQEMLNLLKDVYENISGDDGWAYLGPLGSQIQQLSPSFDSRNYGYEKLGELVRATDLFEIKMIQHGRGVVEPLIKLKSK